MAFGQFRVRRAIAVVSALALSVLASACFMSEQRLFEGRGTALFGKGTMTIEARTDGEETAEVSTLSWTEKGYIDVSAPDSAVLTFHRLPGTLPWTGWYVGQSDFSDDQGGAFGYDLYRKHDGVIVSYDLNCTDLSELEAEKFHMIRSETGLQCTVKDKRDLATAFRTLAKRMGPETTITVMPEQAPAIAIPAPATRV